MAKCSFCGRTLEKGTGKMFVWISGKIDYFCSGRCEKNLLKLHRKPLQTKWTEIYRKEHRKGIKNKEASIPNPGTVLSSDIAAPS